MSRHRNVRNLTYDDLYDGYDDDDWYDEDEYDDDYAYSAKSKNSNNKKNTKTTQTKNKNPQNITSSKKSSPSPAAKITSTTASNNKPAAKKTDSSSIGISVLTPKKKEEKKKISATVALSPSVQGQGSLLRNEKTKDEPKTTSPSQTQKKNKTNTIKNSEDVALMQQILKSQRSRLSMVILGHVDAGKSTLMGQVLLQMGYVKQRLIHKYQKQAAEIGKASFALAWIMDENDSERARGVTMEVATKFVKTEQHDITILDAPGHRDFIPAMITGAAYADVGLLVVAAPSGEFEDGFDNSKSDSQGSSNFNQQHMTGQTREHVILARSLGVSQLVVVVNKLDLCQPAWSKNRFEEIKMILTPFLQSNGFKMKRVRFVPVSALSGVNVTKADSKRDSADDTLLKKWYKGPSLVEAIDMFNPVERDIEKPLRFIIADAYAEGKGITVRGRVTQGFIRANDKVVVLPVGDDAIVARVAEHATVSSSSSNELNTEKNFPEQSLSRSKLAIAGDNAEILITGIDAARISPGCILCHTGNNLRVPVKERFTAQISVMEKLSIPIIRGAQVLFHMHSLDIPAVLSKIISVEKGSSTVANPRIITSGANATVEILLSEKLCVEEYNNCRSMGRFVLRRSSDTIAVGVIRNLIA